jgi:hypothetical protein
MTVLRPYQQEVIGRFWETIGIMGALEIDCFRQGATGRGAGMIWKPHRPEAGKSAGKV